MSTYINLRKKGLANLYVLGHLHRDWHKTPKEENKHGYARAYSEGGK